MFHVLSYHIIFTKIHVSSSISVPRICFWNANKLVLRTPAFRVNDQCKFFKGSEATQSKNTGLIHIYGKHNIFNVCLHLHRIFVQHCHIVQAVGPKNVHRQHFMDMSVHWTILWSCNEQVSKWWYSTGSLPPFSMLVSMDN